MPDVHTAYTPSNFLCTNEMTQSRKSLVRNGRGEIRTRESLSTPHAFQALRINGFGVLPRTSKQLSATRPHTPRTETRPNITPRRTQGVHSGPLRHVERLLAVQAESVVSEGRDL